MAFIAERQSISGVGNQSVKQKHQFSRGKLFALEQIARKYRHFVHNTHRIAICCCFSLGDNFMLSSILWRKQKENDHPVENGAATSLTQYIWNDFRIRTHEKSKHIHTNSQSVSYAIKLKLNVRLLRAIFLFRVQFYVYFFHKSLFNRL